LPGIPVKQKTMSIPLNVRMKHTHRHMKNRSSEK